MQPGLGRFLAIYHKVDLAEALMRLLKFILTLSLLTSTFAFGQMATLCSVAGAPGKFSENLLGALTRFPTPAFVVVEQGGQARYVAPSKMYASVLNTPERSIILNDVEELRFLSQTLAHSSVLLVLNGKVEWNEEKAQKVVAVAKLLDIKVSMVWLNESQSPKALRDMVNKTGGSNFASSDLVRQVEKLCKESYASN